MVHNISEMRWEINVIILDSSSCLLVIITCTQDTDDDASLCACAIIMYFVLAQGIIIKSLFSGVVDYMGFKIRNYNSSLLM